MALLLVAAVLVARTGRDGGEDARLSPNATGTARVERVVDGDTVRLAGIGSVRLIGIDTPEVYGRVECFGPQASAFAKHTLTRGEPVRYRVGAEPRDRYGRLLAYVWLPDGRMFNRLLAERGLARPLTIPPNDALAAQFEAAAAAARRAGRGMWERPGCAPPG